ncbi:transcriptional regulator GcvA [Bordetella genomosp. 12]|uniref:LysR family transcriptional regulator n=1 Tax=Bordetella genomosp. 12 TaxID=463035 RepID=A0A261VCZ6_9BORD|nr:transcriptional regulator GcvA [Bordetella genomosp. 12]OZI71460.1 LysR family transcriptional regulator [Bordetella genomosp. 12]
MKSSVHVTALRALEASARHQSFSAAAAELHVTPAAVGQLVRALEESLGVALFLRSTKGASRLVATEAAQRVLPDIRSGLDRLALAWARLQESAAHGVLTVTASPAFAAKWLLPRIERFQTRYPETDVRLDTSLKPVDFVAQQIDIGVRYGTGNWPGLTAEKLMDEDIYPVCSPELLQSMTHAPTPQALAAKTLIHDLSMDGHAAFPTWEAWLGKAGIAGVATQRGMRINNSAAVLQAAAEGRGVALARSVMARDDLAAGRLVRLFPDIDFVSPLAYYVVYRPECANLPRLAAFRTWLLQESRAA